jgi:hypothetical protein
MWLVSSLLDSAVIEAQYQYTFNFPLKIGTDDLQR